MHKIKAVSFAITLVILSIVGQSQRTVAQSTLARAASINDDSTRSGAITREDKPAPPSINPEIEELRRHLQELQERLQKLETQQSAKAVTTSSPNAGLSSAVTPSTAQGPDNPSKPTKTEPSDKDTDKGFLSFFPDTEVSGFVDGYFRY